MTRGHNKMTKAKIKMKTELKKKVFQNINKYCDDCINKLKLSFS